MIIDLLDNVILPILPLIILILLFKLIGDETNNINNDK